MAIVKFKKIRFSQIPNGAHYFYCRKFSLQLSTASSTIISALGTWPAQFNALLAEEKKFMEWVDQTVLTKEIREADKQLDRAYTALKQLVRAQTYSPIQASKDAAVRVYAMLRKYGSLTKRAYADEEGDILAVLEQTQSGGVYYNDIVTMGLSLSVTELQNRFTLFQKLLRDRDQKMLLKPEKTFKKIRDEIEATYYPMIEIIDGGAALNPTSVFATFINDLNPEINRINAEFKRTLYDISSCEPEPIQVQTYTGFPLTPNPRVLYVTPHDGTTQLEFGKDYNLTFRNNINVGNAFCNIHGKGAYRGKKTVTFIIIRAT
jgi:hypothetical protein